MAQWYFELSVADKVVEGMDVVKTIEPKGSQFGATSAKVTIAGSGAILNMVLWARVEKKTTGKKERKESIYV